MPKPPDEITSSVPAAPADVPNLLARLVRLLEGWTDEEGKRHKGALERLADIEEREVDREKDRATLESQRLDWRKGLGLAAAGGLMTQAFTWLQAHFK